MARVLVPEKIADAGLDALRAAGHDVDVQLGLSPEELVAAVKGAHALIIRSATTVTAEVLDAAEKAIATENKVRTAILEGVDPREAYLLYGKF